MPRSARKVKVLIGTYGIYDLLAQWRHSQIGNPGDNLVECMLGVSPTQDRRIYFDASPISHAITANNKTAVFLIWGTEDDVVDYRTQSLPNSCRRSSRRNSRCAPASCTARRITG